MYNESQKIRFVEDTSYNPDVRVGCVNVFNSIEKYEAQAGKDIAVMTVDELIDLLNKSGYMRRRSEERVLGILREYCRWCAEKKIEGAENAMENIPDVSLETIRVDRVASRTVSSPLQLQVFLDAVFDKESEETMDNVYRALFWLVFGGFTAEDAIEVRTGEVRLGDLAILHGSEPGILYRESLQCIKNCAELTQFKAVRFGYQTRVDRIPGDYLLRGLRTNPDIAVMRNAVSKATQTAFREGRVKKRLRFETVRLSGIFYRMYELERAGIEPDYIDIARRFLPPQSSVTIEDPRKARERERHDLLRAKRDMVNDYETWKKASN